MAASLAKWPFGAGLDAVPRGADVTAPGPRAQRPRSASSPSAPVRPATAAASAIGCALVMPYQTAFLWANRLRESALRTAPRGAPRPRRGGLSAYPGAARSRPSQRRVWPAEGWGPRAPSGGQARASPTPGAAPCASSPEVSTAVAGVGGRRPRATRRAKPMKRGVRRTPPRARIDRLINSLANQHTGRALRARVRRVGPRRRRRVRGPAARVRSGAHARRREPAHERGRGEANPGCLEGQFGTSSGSSSRW